MKRLLVLGLAGVLGMAVSGVLPAYAEETAGFRAVYEVHRAAVMIGYRLLKTRFGKPAHYCSRDSEVIAFRVVSGGGMRGGFDRTEIERISPDRARITRDVREWHSAPQHISVYETDIAYLKKIEEIFRNRVDYRLEDAPYPEFQVLDAPDTSYYFRCSDGVSWSVSTARVLPRSFKNTMKEVRSIAEEGLKAGIQIRNEVICSAENHCLKDGGF